jgi:hypothetical protein
MYVEIGFMRKHRARLMAEVTRLVDRLDAQDGLRREIRAAVTDLDELLEDALHFAQTLGEDILTLQKQLAETEAETEDVHEDPPEA